MGRRPQPFIGSEICRLTSSLRTFGLARTVSSNGVPSTLCFVKCNGGSDERRKGIRRGKEDYLETRARKKLYKRMAGSRRFHVMRVHVKISRWLRGTRGVRANKVETDTSRVQFRIICAFVVFLSSSSLFERKKKIIIIIIERRSGT